MFTLSDYMHQATVHPRLWIVENLARASAEGRYAGLSELGDACYLTCFFAENAQVCYLIINRRTLASCLDLTVYTFWPGDVAIMIDMSNSRLVHCLFNIESTWPLRFTDICEFEDEPGHSVKLRIVRWDGAANQLTVHAEKLVQPEAM